MRREQLRAQCHQNKRTCGRLQKRERSELRSAGNIWCPCGKSELLEGTFLKICLGHITSIVKKAWQRLCHLRRLRKFKIPSDMRKSFYTATIEQVITGSVTMWYGNCTAQYKIALLMSSALCRKYTLGPSFQECKTYIPEGPKGL